MSISLFSFRSFPGQKTDRGWLRGPVVGRKNTRPPASKTRTGALCFLVSVLLPERLAVRTQDRVAPSAPDSSSFSRVTSTHSPRSRGTPESVTPSASGASLLRCFPARFLCPVHLSWIRYHRWHRMSTPDGQLFLKQDGRPVKRRCGLRRERRWENICAGWGRTGRFDGKDWRICRGKFTIYSFFSQGDVVY